MLRFTPIALALLASTTAAQNLMREGDFERGGTDWTLTAFNDPAGTTGFAPARTTGNGPSMAVFADFQTLTSVRSATFRSMPIDLQAGPIPIGLSAMWVKPNTSPMPSPSVNRVEFRIFDAGNVSVFSQQIASPATAGDTERRTFTGSFTVPAAGLYTVEIFLRHSNLAGIPFVNWVDDVFVGELDSVVFGQGCQGTGGFVPVINSVEVPELQAPAFRLQVHDAFAPTSAVLFLSNSNTTWMGLPLPFPLGGGCDLLVGPVLTATAAVAGPGAGQGVGELSFAIPNDPSLRIGRIYTQWLVIDPTAMNPLGAALTAGLDFRIR